MHLIKFVKSQYVFLIPYESSCLKSVHQDVEINNNLQSSPNERLKLQDIQDDMFSPQGLFEDGDIDDEFDPAIQEKIDR